MRPIAFFTRAVFTLRLSFSSILDQPAGRPNIAFVDQLVTITANIVNSVAMEDKVITIVFGSVGATLALIGIFFAYLQLRSSRRRATTLDEERVLTPALVAQEEPSTNPPAAVVQEKLVAGPPAVVRENPATNPPAAMVQDDPVTIPLAVAAQKEPAIIPPAAVAREEPVTNIPTAVV
jgi:hypothetical protein